MLTKEYQIRGELPSDYGRLILVSDGQVDLARYFQGNPEFLNSLKLRNILTEQKMEIMFREYRRGNVGDICVVSRTVTIHVRKSS